MDGPRILVVRLSSMGDVIHTLPAVASLKHSLPHSRLTWVVGPKWASLLDENPFLHEVITLDRRSRSGIVTAWRQLRSQRFDTAVDFQGLIQSALVATIARPDRLYGFHSSQVRERPAALFYSAATLARSEHIVDRNLELAAAAGATSLVHAFPLPAGRPEGDLPDGKFVLASPLAGWGSKQWPLESFEQLAGRLKREQGIPLVVNGPPQAAGLLKQIPSARVHLSGLPGLIDATRRAVAVIGVDSGPTHLAAALGKPGVAIFGPTDPARNGPYGATLAVLRCAGAATTYKRRRDSHASMLAISADAVFESLKENLAVRSAGCSA